MSTINDVPMVMVLLSYFSKYGTWRTDVRTDSHVTTKIFEIDGLPNFLKYGATIARLRRVGAPLQKREFTFCYKSVNLSLEELKNIKIILFLIQELSSHGRHVCRVTQKLRNSNVVYHKTKNPLGAKICMNISFQLLLYIMKVKYQKDQ